MLTFAVAAIAVVAIGAGIVAYQGAGKDDVDPQTAQQWSAAFATALPFTVKLVEPAQVAAQIAQM